MIPVTVIPQYGWADDRNHSIIHEFKKKTRSFLAVRATKQLLINENADIVFTNTLVPFTAAKAAHQLNKPHVWWIHEFGEEDFGFRIGWGNVQKAYRKMNAWSDLIICNSEAILKKFKKQMPAAQLKRLYQPVSWNGLQGGAEKKIARFLMFGQITASKGHVEVLKAITALKVQNKAQGITLHIKGPCENKHYLNELLELISTNGLEEQVRIETGFFQKEEVMPFYEALIVASQAEAFGRVIVEANKAGLRVVVKNSGGAPELINKTNGLLYKDGDELMQILSGEIQLPFVEIKQNYNEEEEIRQLKNWLAAYRYE
jgi:glycosyltransferase involved in cell wall biosynthesis